jgi:hypothetical protein
MVDACGTYTNQDLLPRIRLCRQNYFVHGYLITRQEKAAAESHTKAVLSEQAIVENTTEFVPGNP